MKRSDLNEFADCYKSGERHKREPSERFKAFSYDDLIARDKTNLDIFWLKDASLEDVDALPAPDIIAADIVENLREALEHFSDVDEALSNTL